MDGPGPDPLIFGYIGLDATPSALHLFLNTECGPLGKSLAVDGSVYSPGSAPATLDTPDSDGDHFVKEITWLLKTINAGTQAASMLARDLEHVATMLPNPLEARTDMARAIHDALQGFTENLNITAMFTATSDEFVETLTETETVKSYLGLLPPQDAAQGNDWLGLADVPANTEHLLPLLLLPFGLTFLTASAAGRAMVLKTLAWLSGPQSNWSRRFMRKSYALFASLLSAAHDMGRSYTLQQQEPSMQIARLQSWAAHSLALVAALELAYQDYAPSQHQRTAILENFHLEHSCSLQRIRDNVTVLQADYLAIPPAQPSMPLSDSRDRSDGLKFLSMQLNRTDSQYLIPAVKASESDWIAWFDKVIKLHDLYPGLPAKLTIPCLVGSLSDDDHRIFGWNDFSKGTEVTIESFVKYVRKRVIPSGNVRRKALQELDDLGRNLQVVPDCSALKTKLTLLIARIHTVVSDEPEPQTLLQTCLLVYRLLAKAKLGRGGIQSEWQAFDAYRPTETFEQFLDSNLHLPLQNITLLQEYLDLVYSLLERAHRMRVQTRDPQVNAATTEREKQIAAAQLLGVSHSVLLNWQRSDSPAGRQGKRHNATATESPAKRQNKTVAATDQHASHGRVAGRGSGTHRGRDTGRASTSETIPSSSTELTPKYEAALGGMQKDSRLCLARTRERHNLAPLPTSEAWVRWRAGACLYCCEPSQSGLPHPFRQCPLGTSERDKGSDYSRWKNIFRKKCFT